MQTVEQAHVVTAAKTTEVEGSHLITISQPQATAVGGGVTSPIRRVSQTTGSTTAATESLAHPGEDQGSRRAPSTSDHATLEGNEEAVKPISKEALQMSAPTAAAVPAS